MNLPIAVRLLALLPLLAVGQDPLDELDSKDPLVRVAALDRLTERDEDVEKQVAKQVKDEDWEVREAAVRALGRVGSAKRSQKVLLKEALEAPAARMRRAACESLARLDPLDASEALIKKCSGKSALRGLESLAELVAAARRLPKGAGVVPFELGKIERALGAKAAVERSAAARVLAAAAMPKDATGFARILARPELTARTDALDLAGELGGLELLPSIWKRLAEEDLTDVEERRVRRALLGIAARHGEVDLVAGVTAANAPAARAARVLDSALEARLASLDSERAIERLLEWTGASAAADRRAAASALATAGGRAADERLAELAAGDTDYQVRIVALEGLVRAFGIGARTNAEDGDDDAPASQSTEVEGARRRLGVVLERLARDEDAEVRERAAVLLAAHPAAEARAALAAALGDRDWRVVTCAAVSLGRTRAESALESLLKLTDAPDWRARGAAAIALGELERPGVVEPLIAALEDTEAAVRRSAFESLRRLSGQGAIEPTVGAWSEWWEANRERHRFRDRRAIAERQRRFGYSTPSKQIYEGLDVIVLASRGDHIESILERLEIEHRLTAGAQVVECGLHGWGVFVANCTGEVEDGDIERLEWFVRVGGSLFGSCWALSQTIERIYPGILARFHTRDEVLDDVRAEVLAPPGEHRFLRGAFSKSTVPIYHLEGAHLIDVLVPERAEVLIDSPDAAERHGEGNLAAWFRAGHGVILDSVNHFDLQGLATAVHLKTPEERQGYAIDHLGLDYASLRELRDDACWKSNHRAAAEVWDASAFEFITNFVRDKRLRDG